MALHNYQIYGLDISSNIKLGQLEVSKPLSARARIKFELKNSRFLESINWFHNITDDCGTTWAKFGRTQQGYVVRFQQSCEFYVDINNRSVKCYPIEESNIQNIEAYFLTQAMPLVLSLLGYTVLHAAAVEVNGRALVFSGNQDYGKSTIAAAFVSAGYRLISDDTLPVFLNKDKIFAVPALPEVRLEEQKIKSLFNNSDELLKTTAFSKQRVNLNQSFCQECLAISSLFFLNLGGSETIHIESADVQTSFKQLVANSYRFNIENSPTLAKEFSELTSLSAQNRSYVLSYPRNLSLLPQVTEKVVSFVESMT